MSDEYFVEAPDSHLLVEPFWFCKKKTLGFRRSLKEEDFTKFVSHVNDYKDLDFAMEARISKNCPTDRSYQFISTDNLVYVEAHSMANVNPPGLMWPVASIASLAAKLYPVGAFCLYNWLREGVNNTIVDTIAALVAPVDKRVQQAYEGDVEYFNYPEVPGYTAYWAKAKPFMEYLEKFELK